MNLASRYVLGMRVDATSYETASRRVLRWAHRGQSAYVCVATVHTTMEAYDSTKTCRSGCTAVHLSCWRHSFAS
jgi:UDP-N-acetyl-D-mannosaminuronic acid transferase (WecB/TagA/CpsF family)